MGGSPQRLFHLPTWGGLKVLLRELKMPFAHLLIVWFAAFVAIGAVLTMFPLALIQAFGVSTGLPATTYAFATAVSLAIYPPAASIAHQRGARIVLCAGYTARAVAIGILAVSFLSNSAVCRLRSPDLSSWFWPGPCWLSAARRSQPNSHRARRARHLVCSTLSAR